MNGSSLGCLVTGANGFIGAALVEKMREKGFIVTGSVREGNNSEAGQALIETGNIDGNTDWRAVLVNQEAVIHLANCAHLPVGSDIHATAIRSTNEEGTLNLAEQALQAGVRRFVYLSSIKVNGEATQGRPFCHDDSPAPKDAYGHSKWNAEKALKALCVGSAMELVIIRPPLVYGPGAKSNLRTLSRAVEAGRLMPFGAIRNRRDLIGLGNLIDLILTCITHPDAANQTFLCADGRALTTPDLVRYIAAAKGKAARLVKMPVPFLAVACQVLGRSAQFHRLAGNLEVDIQHTRDVLGWTPPYSVEEGMQWAFG